jgi:hypothetical protein
LVCSGEGACVDRRLGSDCSDDSVCASELECVAGTCQYEPMCRKAVALAVNGPPIDSNVKGGPTDTRMAPCGGIDGRSKESRMFSVVGNGGRLKVRTCINNESGNPFNKEFDSALTVWRGSCPDALVCVGGNDNDETDNCGSESGYEWQSACGQTYFIHVTTASGAPEPFGIEVVQVTPACRCLNDRCSTQNQCCAPLRCYARRGGIPKQCSACKQAGTACGGNIECCGNGNLRCILRRGTKKCLRCIQAGGACSSSSECCAGRSCRRRRCA